jgi:hypothetical protein
MKYVLLAWAAPLGLFWGWFFLSANDINFGSIYLSRALHELVFELYGDMLGVAPETIPWLVAKACIFDTLLILAIWAFRRRREIGAWWRANRARFIPSADVAEPAAGRAPPAE